MKFKTINLASLFLAVPSITKNPLVHIETFFKVSFLVFGERFGETVVINKIKSLV